MSVKFLIPSKPLSNYSCIPLSIWKNWFHTPQWRYGAIMYQELGKINHKRPSHRLSKYQIPERPRVV
jgi:hypothetical protein